MLSLSLSLSLSVSLSLSLSVSLSISLGLSPAFSDDDSPFALRRRRSYDQKLAIENKMNVISQSFDLRGESLYACSLLLFEPK